MRAFTAAGRRLRYHTRDEWQIPSRPVTGPASSPSHIHTVMAHWPGASDGWRPPRDVASHLRWAHDLYLTGRGYSYGYNFVIGPNPVNWAADPVELDVWAVRGIDIRNAANDGDFPPFSEARNPNWNGRTTSIQIMCSKSHPPTADQITQFRYMVAHLDVVYAETLDVQPHNWSDWTDCPGVVERHMHDLRARPQPPAPPPTPQEDDDMIAYSEIMSVNSAPSVADVTAGRADRWLNAALLRAALFDVTGSDEYDQAAALKLDAALKRRD